MKKPWLHALSLIHPTLFLLPLIIFLNACAIHQPSLQEVDEQKNAETQARWETHRASVSTIKTWRVKGKIAVKAGKKGGHATLRWERKEAGQHIELSGPLGGGRVVIDSDAEGARLQDTKGGDLRGVSVAKLVQQRLGWPLPFEQLPFWLRGLPSSDDASMEWGEQGRIERMNDQGWQVSYPEYQAVTIAGGVNVFVPRQIEFNALPGTLRVYDKDGAFLGEDFFVRLIVKSWLP